MNKVEWRSMYSAARILLSARYIGGNGHVYVNTKEPAREIVWDITHKQVQDMGYGICEACFYGLFGSTYDIKTNKWAIGYNSKQFNRRNPIRETLPKWRIT